MYSTCPRCRILVEHGSGAAVATHDCNALPPLEAENAKLRAEVERLTTVVEVYRLEAFDLQAKLRTSDLQVREMTEALQKIHDLTGQITPEHHLNLGAIQAWCHKVLGPCAGERHHHENCDTLDPFGRDKPCNCGFMEKQVAPLPTIEDLLGECRECNRLARDCGGHGPAIR